MESNAKGFATSFDWEMIQYPTQAEGGFAAAVSDVLTLADDFPTLTSSP